MARTPGYNTAPVHEAPDSYLPGVTHYGHSSHLIGRGFSTGRQNALPAVVAHATRMATRRWSGLNIFPAQRCDHESRFTDQSEGLTKSSNR
ncbi:hypothetical protein TYRP_004563 [Tyrophagus putrescentiae]|nr:hypothetical protein TYRP_007113 [Tyrophagus putrescentiae]KAH9393544.1 hypothetical protein TYRP_021679 [Tyrophagus putrescentiae]KAH9393546.1 hypothetical protein TYRP_021681 [Tyrophagus putrescentiae]KAH9394445.1 hypothetical protein TYRP_004497 [Tyrophagus putrescentiae]KAH9394449.1 hypothetical protein TYRP_004501 [Tyrophagus putrescentiae]